MPLLTLQGIVGFVNGANSADNQEQLVAPSSFLTANFAPALPTTQVPLTLVSNNAADSITGTGIQAVQLVGLDSDYNPIAEWVPLNGTTTVTTQKSFMRINDAYGTSFGSGKKAAGTITINHGSLRMCEILAGCRRRTELHYTTPKNREARVRSLQTYFLKDAGLGGSGDLGVVTTRIRFTNPDLLNALSATSGLNVEAFNFNWSDSTSARRMRGTVAPGSADTLTNAQTTVRLDEAVDVWVPSFTELWFPEMTDIFVSMAGTSVASVIAYYGGLMTLEVN